MKKKFFIISFLCLVIIVLFAGCHSVSENGDTDSEALPVPYSEGPDSPPSVRGPDSPPPQSMTESEDIQYSLPESD